MNPAKSHARFRASHLRRVPWRHPVCSVLAASAAMPPFPTEPAVRRVPLRFNRFARNESGQITPPHPPCPSERSEGSHARLPNAFPTRRSPTLHVRFFVSLRMTPHIYPAPQHARCKAASAAMPPPPSPSPRQRSGARHTRAPLQRALPRPRPAGRPRRVGREGNLVPLSRGAAPRSPSHRHVICNGTAVANNTAAIEKSARFTRALFSCLCRSKGTAP